MTATALEELHNFGFAHLDVRIPNICFAKEGTDQYIVKLIDLDRCATNHRSVAFKWKGEMYINRSNEKWLPSRYDWKQLGLLAANAIFDCSYDDIIDEKSVKVDECL